MRPLQCQGIAGRRLWSTQSTPSGRCVCGCVQLSRASGNHPCPQLRWQAVVPPCLTCMADTRQSVIGVELVPTFKLRQSLSNPRRYSIEADGSARYGRSRGGRTSSRGRLRHAGEHPGRPAPNHPPQAPERGRGPRPPPPARHARSRLPAPSQQRSTHAGPAPARQRSRARGRPGAAAAGGMLGGGAGVWGGGGGAMAGGGGGASFRGAGRRVLLLLVPSASSPS